MKIKNLISVCLTLISFIYLTGMDEPETQEQQNQEEQSNKQNRIIKVTSLKLQAASKFASTVFGKEIKNLQNDLENIIFDIIDNPKINNKDTILKLIEYIQKTDRVTEIIEIINQALTKKFTDTHGRYRMLIGFLSADIEKNKELIKNILSSVQPEIRNQILLSNTSDNPILINALKQDQIKFAEQFLDLVDSETRKKILFSQSILETAINYRLVELVKAILEKIDATTRNQLFLSSQILATAGNKNQVALVKTILEMADPETRKKMLLYKDTYQWSALRRAVSSNRLQLVKILLEMADPETRKQMILDKNENCDVNFTVFTLALENSPESILILLDPQLVDEQTRKEIVSVCKELYFRKKPGF